MSFSEEAALFGQFPLHHGLIAQPCPSLLALGFPQLQQQVFHPQMYQDIETVLTQQSQQAQVSVSPSHYASRMFVVPVFFLCMVHFCFVVIIFDRQTLLLLQNVLLSIY